MPARKFSKMSRKAKPIATEPRPSPVSTLAGVTDGKAIAAAMKSASAQIPKSMISTTSSARAARMRARLSAVRSTRFARTTASQVSARKQIAMPRRGSTATNSSTTL